jgi:site-specific DNA recombinase
MTAPAQVRAVGYVRVSSEDQAREGVSLAAQAERIAAYAAAKGWALVAVVRDEGLSAKDLNRTGLQNLLDALPRRQRDFEAVVVTKLDRLTRSVRDLGTLMDTFKRAKVAFVSIGEDVNTGSAAGELFFNLVASVSQWERRAIGERTVAAMAHLRAKGRRTSRFAPFGYRLEGDRVVPDAREQEVLKLMRSLRSDGLSLREISRALAERGHLARSGAPFSSEVVRTSLAPAAIGTHTDKMGA